MMHEKIHLWYDPHFLLVSSVNVKCAILFTTVMPAYASRRDSSESVGGTKGGIKVVKKVHTFTSQPATTHLWMDKWYSSWKFDACNRNTSGYRLARAINLNLRSIDDDACVMIPVLESSWHAFLNRSLVRQKLYNLDTVLWFTPKRIARSSGENLCLSLPKVNSKAYPLASVFFSFLSCHVHWNLLCPAVQCVNTILSQNQPTWYNKNSRHST